MITNLQRGRTCNLLSLYYQIWFNYFNSNNFGLIKSSSFYSILFYLNLFYFFLLFFSVVFLFYSIQFILFFSIRKHQSSIYIKLHSGCPFVRVQFFEHWPSLRQDVYAQSQLIKESKSLIILIFLIFWLIHKISIHHTSTKVNDKLPKMTWC